MESSEVWSATPESHSSGSTQVLDVGSKTGAAALLFAALGARTVVALEEDRRACAAVGVLAEALALGAVVEPLCASLYDVGVLGPGAEAPRRGAFDVAVASGVLHTLSDPLLALRLLYGALRPGGVLLVETPASDLRAPEPAPPGRDFHYVVEYWGASLPGANAFLPEPKALARLLADAGFVDVRVTDESPAVIAAARKPDAHADFRRAGVSQPGVC